jgi:hypothetical protein
MLHAWKVLRALINFPRQRSSASQKEIPGGHEIILGKGLGDIHFALSSREIESILGLPDSAEHIESRVLAYTYHSIATVLYFYEYQAFDAENSLMEIRTENANCTLFGKLIIGAREDDLLVEIGRHDLEFKLEHKDDILSFTGINLDCHFRDGHVEKVEFRMFF